MKEKWKKKGKEKRKEFVESDKIGACVDNIKEVIHSRLNNSGSYSQFFGKLKEFPTLSTEAATKDFWKLKKGDKD